MPFYIVDFLLDHVPSSWRDYSLKGICKQIWSPIFLFIILCIVNYPQAPFVLSSHPFNLLRNDEVQGNFSSISYAQPTRPSSEMDAALWNRTYGGVFDDSAGSLIEVSAGGFICVGRTNSWGNGMTDAWLVRLDADGNLLWNRTYGGPDHDSGRSVIECSDGGFAFVGTTYSFGPGAPPDANNVWLVRTDADGNLLWNQTYGCDICDNGRDLVECSDGGFALAANSKIAGSGDFDIWLIRTDVDGNPLWWRTYGELNSHEDVDQILQVGSGFLLVGKTNSIETKDDVFLVRTDENGNTLWTQTYSTPIFDDAECTIPVSSGGFIIAGGIGSNWFMIWLIRIDDTGQHLWNNTYGGPYTSAGGIVECSDGGFAISGSTSSSPYLYGPDAFLLRLDQNGNQLWTRTYGTPENSDGLGSIVITTSGYLMCMGHTGSYGAGGRDAWMLCIPAPQWVDEPDDYYSELGTSVSYDLNATAPNDIDQWWINDTNDFYINTEGIIRNSTVVSVGTYPLFVSVNDTHGHFINATITFFVEPLAPPLWVVPPSDRILELNTIFYYNLDATDVSGLDMWWLNDTSMFAIDNQGVIRNSTALGIGRYGLRVWVNDTLGEILTGSFTVLVQDTTPPYWVESPVNQNLHYGMSLSYQLIAADYGGIDTWWLNDTTHFSISNSGFITNNILLSVGAYGLQIWVNDTSANTLTATVTIIVQAATPALPSIPGFPLVAIVIGIALSLSLGLCFRNKRRLTPEV